MKNQEKRIYAVSGLVLVIIAGMSIAYTISQNNDLRDENELLQSNLTKVNSSLDAISEEYSSINKELIITENRLKIKNEELYLYTVKFNALEKAVDTIKTNYNNLHSKVKDELNK